MSLEPPPLFVVSSSVAVEATTEWNRWYDDVHLEEVMGASPSIRSATRYRRRYGDAVDDYLALYSFAEQAGLETFLRDDAVREMAGDFERRWGGVSTVSWAAFLPLAQRRRD